MGTRGSRITDENRIFLIEVLDRSSATLTDLILQHVKEGSIIITDKWRGYSRLKIIMSTIQ